MKKELSVPKNQQERFEAICARIDAFCAEHLNDEYAQMSRKLCAALARKRPAPIATGREDIWACAIVYALGKINFLFDSGSQPYLRADDLCEKFGVSKSTGSAKATLILDKIGAYPMDPTWTFPSKLLNNPMAWFLKINGYIVDARTLPREVQEQLYEEGWIPFVPADREGTMES
jgi:hypothetical protein